MPVIEEKPAEKEKSQSDKGWGNDDKDSGWSSNTGDSWGDSSWDTKDTVKSKETRTVTKPGEDLSAFAIAAIPTIDIPQPKGAIIEFKHTDLYFVTRYDSTAIQNTSGSYMLENYTFVGHDGKFDWSTAGMDPAEAFVTFSDYTFNVRNPSIEAEKVKLSYDAKLSVPAEGYFEFKSIRHDSPAEADYPRFISYSNNIKVKGLGNDKMKYSGGFALQGIHVLGTSLSGGKSTIVLEGNDNARFKAVANLFNFKDSVITADDVAMSIYHGRDSITHPSVKFRYYEGENRVVAIKELNGYKIRAFNSSYYNMSIDADMIKWDMNSDSLNISVLNAKSMLPAYFKSKDYFNEKEIDELSGVYKFNPLLLVYNYGGKKANSREFYLSNMVEDMKLNENAVRAAMKQLEYLDFIDFNDASGRIYLKDKTLHYVRSKNSRIDYDDLIIPSLATRKPNATLNLKTDNLTVRGIDKFYISELLDVYIYPNQNEVKLQKNRDFEFDGQMYAGNFEFVGRNFTFKYDSFLVDMLNIDSIRFYIDDQKSQFQKRQVDNKLVSLQGQGDQSIKLSTNDQSTSGTLYINRPDNKSGRKIFPQYPIFNADRGAVVYFDSPDILKGAYDKSVYFIVPPFGIDSLSSSDPATIGFEGRFVSGGIFPDFNERLKIMPDNSLGFEHNIPPSGFNLYGGSGKMYNKISLDKNGLVGEGSIYYLSSNSQSDKYVFYQDSVIAEGTNFAVKKGPSNGVSYPDITVGNYQMKWEPLNDNMYISNELDTFRLYNNSTMFSGTVNMTAKGLLGEGSMSTRGFESESKEFEFKENNFTAKHSDFEMKSENPKKPLMSGEDIRLEFDMLQEVADISPEITGMAAIDFPYAQVKTSISKAKWDLKENKVYMTKPPDVALENSYFYATRKELDSLAFNGNAAVYDLKTSQLKVMGIPYIEVADAYITPENNEVMILENAQIGELKNTTIVIDTLNEYHRLIDGTIDIVSRKKFTGSATYQFVNAVKDTFNIKFGKFELWKDPAIKNATLQTVSSGTIDAQDNLLISQAMYYKGDVTMYARNKALELDGYVKLDLNRKDYDTWVKYHSQDEETQDVIFNFDNAVTENGQRLNAGIHYASMSQDLYTTFVEDKKLDSDEDFFIPHGILFFDPESKMYEIEDTSRADGSSLVGKIFGYNDNTGDIKFEGPVNFMGNSGKVTLTANGFGTGNVKTNVYDVNALAKFDFDFPQQALDAMGSDVFEVVENYGAAEAESDKDILMYKLAGIIGERAAQEYDKRSAQEYIPLTTFAPKIIGNLVFTRLNLEWSPTYNAWYSKDQLGLSSIARKDVNGLLDGFVEIKKGENGDVVNIFIQVSPACWYFFNYEDNRLTTFSSNETFNDIINDKSNVNKAGFGEYVYVLGDKQDALKFINRFRDQYLGIKVPYEINVATEAAPPPIVEQQVVPQDTLNQPQNIKEIIAGEKDKEKEKEKPKQADDTEGF